MNNLSILYGKILFLFLGFFSLPKIDINQHLSDDVASQIRESYRVIGVKDGDTIVILINGKPQTIRLEHIDCPEKKQPFGAKAKQFVSEKCFGKYVQLKGNNKFDRYHRLIAEIKLSNGEVLNKELVKNGLAWHYKKYSKSSEYSNLELTARTKRIGIWSDSNPIEPWKWRKH